MKNHLWSVVAAAVLLSIFVSVSVYAKDYTQTGTFYWKKVDGVYYAYDKQSGELITGQKVGKYYATSDGSRLINAFHDGIYYNGKGKAKLSFKGGWVKALDNYYYFLNQEKVTGFKNIDGKYYYFDNTGARREGIFYVNKRYRYFTYGTGEMVRKRGWQTINGRKYYLGKGGTISEGFFKVGGKKYYQTLYMGVMTGGLVVNGKAWYFDEDGVYNKKLTRRLRNISGSTSLGSKSDRLFFTKFESGSAGYGQVGGDSGKACGKYQFDYRYSLIPLLKWCYKANPEFFSGFKAIISNYKSGDVGLINNQELYDAWTACYEANPKYFARMQDKFALAIYYTPVKKNLSKAGIHLSTRPYVLQGAVFSYSIQEGTSAAYSAVIAAGITDSTDPVTFLEKLYNYRWKDSKGWNKNTLYYYRYQSEKALAIALLANI